MRAKEKGEKLIVCDISNMENVKVFFTDSTSRMPEAVTALVVEVTKMLSKSSSGKYTASQTLEAILSHVCAVSRIQIDNYENKMSGKPIDMPSDMPPNGNHNLN